MRKASRRHKSPISSSLKAVNRFVMFGQKKSGVSLAGRLTLALNGVVVVVTLLAGSWFYLDATHKAKSRVETKARQVGLYLQGVLDPPLWEMNDHAVKVIGQTLMEDQTLNAVTILDSNGSILYQKNRGAGSVALTHNVLVEHQSEAIGSVQLSFSVEALHEQTKKIIRINVTIILIVLLALSLSTIFLINQLLRRPIKQLTIVAKSFGQGSLVDHGAMTRSFREFQPLLNVLKKMEEKTNRQMAKLTNSEERFRSLMDLSPDIVSIVNNEGVLVYISPAALSIHGYTQEEMIGRNTFDLIHPEDKAKCHAYNDAMYKNLPVPKSIQYRYRNKDGSYVWMEATASSQLDNPHIRGLIVISRDITINKLSQEALAKAKESADFANRTKSKFLANMSHEIRTPITAILGFAELLHDSPLAKWQKDHLEIILASTEHLLELINDVLDLSTIEVGKVPIDSSPFSLRGVAREAINSHRMKIKEKGITLCSVIPPEVPDILAGDKTRLKQILVNLLGNAVKFTEKGEVVLSVIIEELQQGSALIRFDVHDTGIGIGQEDLSKIFLPFHQADNSSTRDFGGTGLGLSICSRLSMLMGGDIWAESSLGTGSIFHLRLPFTIDDKKQDSVVLKTGVRPAAWEGPPLNILLVEDNENLRHFFSELLQKHGHNTAFACNGIEALTKLRENEPDVVLMDIQMPIMGGLEAITKLRDSEEETKRHLPVIALTAHAMDDKRQELLERGFDGYVSKPCKAEDLFVEIKKVVKLKDL
jgi:PAS domain S-box-containing protein